MRTAGRKKSKNIEDKRTKATKAGDPMKAGKKAVRGMAKIGLANKARKLKDRVKAKTGGRTTTTGNRPVAKNRPVNKKRFG